MHRSGTSALTRVLNLLGAALPQNVMPPARGNVLGLWEPIRVAALHDEILASMGSSWSALNGPDEAWFDSPQADVYVEKIKEVVRREYLDAPLIVVKDPRLSLLFPLWSRALGDLGIACNPVIALRNPLEVAQSLCLREGHRQAEEDWHIDRAGLLALHYNLSAERWTRGHARVFCHFSDLLGDWRGVVRRIGEQFDVAWPNECNETAAAAIEAFLRPSCRHHKAADQPVNDNVVWAEAITPVYLALQAACSGLPINSELFDQMRSAFNGTDKKRFEVRDARQTWLMTAFQLRVSLLEIERDRLASRQAGLERRIRLLTESTSWRATAPFRTIVGKLRGWLGEFNEIQNRPAVIAHRLKTFHLEPAE